MSPTRRPIDSGRRGLLAASTAWVAGCAGPRIDTRFAAVSQGPRVDLVVLHYTALDFETSLRVLTQQVVSSHYLVDVDPPTIYRLVPEDRRANHAGVSAWAGRTLVNMSSIGIEIVNPGRVFTPEGERYAPYPAAQIDAVIALLRAIMARWGIPKERVVGHADVAPGRKQDPGPLFPWKRLADAGLALWFDEALAAALRPHFEKAPPPLSWFRQRLAAFGYALPQDAGDLLDAHTRDVLVSFQMRFRPARWDGEPDAETAAILAALTPG
ncbi:MAG TPA: N-acetylmuramoyl-L-alanine amidase [Rubrivivax sp.]|nr:N-acetylmuramoyl-L-alanine amidase [Rubrivivax sp.]